MPARTQERVKLDAFAVAVLVLVALLATASPATARSRDAGISEAALRAVETRALGPAHAAEHAAERAAMRSWQRRWRRMSATARRRWLRRAGGAPLARAASGPPSDVGAWDSLGGAAPFDLPDYAIHAAMLPTGKVMLWGYPVSNRTGTGPNNHGDAWLWDPSQGYGHNAFTEVPPPTVTIAGQARVAPIYCSGESLLANGDLFISGGNLDLSNNSGLDLTFTFDPFNETWHQQGGLGHGRWYPGQVVLPDGRVAVLGGYTENGNTDNNPQLEVWPQRSLPPPDESSRDAEGLPVEHVASADRTTALYPHLFLTPAGKVLLAGPKFSDSSLLDLNAFTWTDLGHLPGDLDRIGSNAVLMPGGGSVMQVGGYDYATYANLGTATAASSTTSIATDGSSGWTTGSSQYVGRAYSNTVLLPDGTMATFGGSAGRSTSANNGTYWTNGDDPALKTVELFDPGTGTWRVGPSEQRFRTYHSIALLLPDGSVLSAGDDLHEDQFRPDATWIGSAEIYKPPYFFKGARPSIASAPGTVHWGEPFAVSTPDEATIDHAVLMAPSATTHGADMTQRQVSLAVTGRTSGQAVTLAGPSDPNTAPPGYYMLFLVDSQGVPSVASWVRVTAAGPSPPAGPSGASGEPAPRPPGPSGTGSATPRVSGLSISPLQFAAALRPAGRARRTGATVSFRLSTRARVTFKVERRALGRRRKGRCEAPSRRNRGRPRCRRWALARGSFSRAGLAGPNRVGFSGWIGGRVLAPGSYRLVVTPRGGSASRVAFRIVR